MEELDSIRQDQASVKLTVDGVTLPFIFNRREGGAVTSDSNKTFPGGGRKQKAHGGPSSVEDVTLNGEFVPQQDHAMIKWLKSRVGKGTAVCIEQMIDVDGRAMGGIDPDVWRGKLMSVHSGDYDASSGDPRELAVGISTDGTA